MTKIYTVILEETVDGEFEIEASSPQEAFEKAIENYRNGIMVNEPGDCQEVKISIIDGDETVIDFTEI